MMVKIRENLDLQTSFCIEERPEPCNIVIFGASGDLTKRKLIPSIFNLYKSGLLPKNFYLLGFARSELNDLSFRESLKEYPENFLSRCFYQSGNYDNAKDYQNLHSRIKELDNKFQTGGNKIFYFATPPSLYGTIPEFLNQAGLISKDDSPWTRFIIEKPFGHDLESACKLNKELTKILKEDQIYRIDHYLGKETVQNILMFRFANLIFEPVWNRKYIDNIQITVAEDIGVGHRTGYYDQAGHIRDVFQNHMLQLLALIAMDEPRSFDPKSIRDGRSSVIKSIKSIGDVVRGQYATYRSEKDVDSKSDTETYVAAKLELKSKRWKGVPFYLRSGKRLPRKNTEIAVVFKPSCGPLFSSITNAPLGQNVIFLNIQPNEGIGLTINAKHPGPKLCMSALSLDFCYHEVFGGNPPEAYGRLLLDCMLGDQTLFIREDGMRASWKLIDPILKSPPPLHFYDDGSTGPKAVDDLPTKDGRSWVSSLGSRCE